jgi:hypothetical protein
VTYSNSVADLHNSNMAEKEEHAKQHSPASTGSNENAAVQKEKDGTHVRDDDALSKNSTLSKDESDFSGVSTKEESATDDSGYIDKWDICEQNNIRYEGSGYDSEC